LHIRNAKELGLLLRSARQESAISQQALADRIGASRHWIMDLERGKPTLEIGLIFRAVSALGLSVDIRTAGQVPSRRGASHHDAERGDVEAARRRVRAALMPRHPAEASSRIVPDLEQVLTRAQGLDLGMPHTQSGTKPNPKKKATTVRRTKGKGPQRTKVADR